MAYLFNGATHVISKATAPVSDLPVTMFGRIRLTDFTVTTVNHQLVQLAPATTGWGIKLTVERTGGAWKARAFSATSTGASATSTNSIGDNNWHTAIGEWTTDSARQVWLDNAGNASNSTAKTVGTLTRMQVGANEPLGGGLAANVGHEIADIAVWSGTLTADERAALEAGASPAFIRPDILAAYWPGLAGEPDWFGDPFTTITGATKADHPRVYMPARPRIVGIDVASGTTGALAATEGADTASLAGNVPVQGSVSAGEGSDTASISGDVLVQGSLSASEDSDSASLSGDVLVQGVLSANEGSDTASLAGNVPVQGVLDTIEGSDTASFVGSGAQAVATGSLAASEAADTIAFVGLVLVQGSLSASEVADTLSFMGSRPASRRTVGVRRDYNSRPPNASYSRPRQVSHVRPANISRGTR